MLKFAATYILTLLLMLVIDGTWIALVALPMFRRTLGQDMLTARAVPAVLFYLVYTAGIQVFVLPAGQGSWPLTALNGARFSACSLTQLTTSRITRRCEDGQRRWRSPISHGAW